MLHFLKNFEDAARNKGCRSHRGYVEVFPCLFTIRDFTGKAKKIPFLKQLANFVKMLNR